MSHLPEADEEPVPKLPRGRGLKLSGPELFRIAITLITLIGLIVLTKPCANAVSNFVTSFDQGSDQSQAMPKPGNVDMPAENEYEHLDPGMSEQELKAAIERAKAKARGQGSAATGVPAGSGSAAAPAAEQGGSNAAAPATEQGGSNAAAPATEQGGSNAAASPTERGGSRAKEAHGAAESGTSAPPAPVEKP